MTTIQRISILMTGLAYIPISHAAILNCDTTTSCSALDINCKRTQRVCSVLQSEAACQQSKLGSFYWEIGNGSKVLANGKVGSGDLTDPDKVIEIASASKWIYATYAEARGLVSSLAEKRLLTMRGGHTLFNPGQCQNKTVDDPQFTVDECYQLPGNSYVNSLIKGKFYYNGGDMQEHAVSYAGLGGYSKFNLANQYNAYLNGVAFGFDFPAVAGGMAMKPSQYGVFLRALLSNKWNTKSYLGKDSIAVVPSDDSNLIRNPSGTDMRYSYGHWIESNTTPLPGGPIGDGAYSSPGKYGFYPWIDSNKNFYGLLSRKSDSNDAYRQSATCGQYMRKAWLGN